MCHKQCSIRSCIIILGTLLAKNYLLNFLSFIYIYFFLYLCIRLCFLCIVICMRSFHSAHIFIVFHGVMCINSYFTFIMFCFNIVFNYTAHCASSPQNSYVYIHWILDIKYFIIINNHNVKCIILCVNYSLVQTESIQYQLFGF